MRGQQDPDSGLAAWLGGLSTGGTIPAHRHPSFILISIGDGLPRLANRGQADPEFGLARRIIDWRDRARTIKKLYVDLFLDWRRALKARNLWSGGSRIALVSHLCHCRPDLPCHTVASLLFHQRHTVACHV